MTTVEELNHLKECHNPDFPISEAALASLNELLEKIKEAISDKYEVYDQQGTCIVEWEPFDGYIPYTSGGLQFRTFFKLTSDTKYTPERFTSEYARLYEKAVEDFLDENPSVPKEDAEETEEFFEYLQDFMSMCEPIYHIIVAFVSPENHLFRSNEEITENMIYMELCTNTDYEYYRSKHSQGIKYFYTSLKEFEKNRQEYCNLLLNNFKQLI